MQAHVRGGASQPGRTWRVGFRAPADGGGFAVGRGAACLAQGEERGQDRQGRLVQAPTAGIMAGSRAGLGQAARRSPG